MKASVAETFLNASSETVCEHCSVFIGDGVPYPASFLANHWHHPAWKLQCCDLETVRFVVIVYSLGQSTWHPLLEVPRFNNRKCHHQPLFSMPALGAGLERYSVDQMCGYGYFCLLSFGESSIEDSSKNIFSPVLLLWNHQGLETSLAYRTLDDQQYVFLIACFSSAGHKHVP